MNPIYTSTITDTCSGSEGKINILNFYTEKE